MRAFVTGASGFIGSELVRQLVAAGHDVAGLVRTAEAGVRLREWGATPIVGDVRDSSVVARAVSGADAVAHLALPRAGERKSRGASDVYDRGATTVLDACRRAPPKSFVLASGALGMYRHAPGERIDESAPEEPTVPSVAARHRIDERVREAFRAWGLRASILRPPIVYGVGSGFRDYFLELMRRGLFRIVGDGTYFANLVHVEDAAAAYRLALERGTAGETLLVVDDEPVPIRTFADFLAAEMGKRPPGRIPAFLAKLVVGRDAVTVFQESVRLRSDALKARLGWSPRYPTYRDGIPGVVRAFLASA